MLVDEAIGNHAVSLLDLGNRPLMKPLRLRQMERLIQYAKEGNRPTNYSEEALCPDS